MVGRVLVEDHCLGNHGGGIKTYTEQLMRHWPPDAPVQLVGFRGPRTLASPAHPQPAGPLRPLRNLFATQPPPSDPSKGRGLLFRGYRGAFAAAARWGNYAAVFQPNNLCPHSSRPMIATLHDLSVIEHPQWHTPGRVERWRRYLPEAVKRTRQWITVSAFTRDRMIELLGIAQARIAVIPEAARPLPHPRERAAGFPENYLLFVGTLEPRKNLALLLDAYARLPVASRSACPLVLLGPPGWGPEKFWHSLIDHPMAREVLVSGYLPDDQLAAALAGARALLLPSFYEGFGLPLLEAMAAGCPVACSHIPAFAEVAGDAAALLPPADVDAWTAIMARAIEDAPWRRRLAAAGQAHAAGYSWDHAARRHAALFAQVAGGS
jgi:alpha-1,3-rhamnosyl/mannosyltransferase